MAASVKPQVDAALEQIDLDRNRYQAVMETNHGTIRLDFFPEVAPGHVKNFLALARIGFYNGGCFHRVIRGFMIQGGCPEGIGTGGPGYTIAAEFNDTPHEAGVLSMARTNDPNSAGSQFFICLDRQPHLDRNYTAFGRVADAESMATVQAIGDVRTGAQDRPVETVEIRRVEVVETPL